MAPLTNFVKFDADGGLTGNIACLEYDHDFTGVAVCSDNEKAPTYRLYGKTPLGRSVEVGAIWERVGRGGKTARTISIKVQGKVENMALGRYPGQDDEDLCALIDR